MHLSEGVLSGPLLGAGVVLAVAGIGVGLSMMENRKVPEVAVVASALFVASLVRFPLGPVSVHLTLNGLAGILLGWTAFPAVFVALLLQALLFQYGGFTTLGANTVVMAAPAVAAYYIARPLVRNRRSAAFGGLVAGALGALGGAAIIALLLMGTAESMKGLALALAASYLPVAVVEAVVTAFVVMFLHKVKPELLLELPMNGTS